MKGERIVLEELTDRLDELKKSSGIEELSYWSGVDNKLLTVRYLNCILGAVAKNANETDAHYINRAEEMYCSCIQAISSPEQQLSILKHVLVNQAMENVSDEMYIGTKPDGTKFYISVQSVSSCILVEVLNVMCVKVAGDDFRKLTKLLISGYDNIIKQLPLLAVNQENIVILPESISTLTLGELVRNLSIEERIGASDQLQLCVMAASAALGCSRN